MAASQGWKRFISMLSNTTTRKHFIAGVCTICGSTYAIYSYTGNNRNAFLLNQSVFKPKAVFAASADLGTTSADPKTINLAFQHTREKRFCDFASIQVGGDVFMTPQDFLESVTDEYPRPRIGHLQLADRDVQTMLKKTPDRKKSSSSFFRNLHNRGLISYTEYLFFLCILTKPNAGFNIAFNMFDADGNQRVDKKEFMVLGEIFRKSTENTLLKNQESQGTSNVEKRGQTMVQLKRQIQESDHKSQDTTLLVHLFGQNGKNDLSYDDFSRFTENLQTEVLEIEFLAYSHGMMTISEIDFARMVLKYTDVADIEEYVENLKKRIPEEKGITFEDFKSFFLFLNNLEDFTIAMQMYTLAGRSIGQDEFKRAVKVSTGQELSEHLVNTLFQLFDKDGDSRLSRVEFIGVMKDRIHRGFRRHGITGEYVGLEGYARCVCAKLRAYIRELATHSQPNKFH